MNALNTPDIRTASTPSTPSPHADSASAPTLPEGEARATQPGPFHPLLAKTALVLGATGGVGGSVARSLRDAGWTVRALRRGMAVDQEVRDGIHWQRGDAMNRDEVMAAAQGCGVIVHAVNPPGYQRWNELVLPMLDNTIAAASVQGATVVLPGTVYNFGPDALPEPREHSPQHPVTRKGAIRVEMERRLQQGAERGRFRVIILRAGDFFGPGAANSWFSQCLVTPGKPVAKIQQPGTPGVGHQWAYLPDVAETMKRLIERRDRLAAFTRLHFEGHWDASGEGMADTVRRVVMQRTGRSPRMTRFPWWVLPLGAPFVTLLREMAEMRYLWREPLHLSDAALRQMLGDDGVPHTDWETAVEASLEFLGCLPAATSLKSATPHMPPTSHMPHRSSPPATQTPQLPH